MASETTQSQPSALDATEAQLWRTACALTGSRARATHALCTVLANAERPGRRGVRAPMGLVRLTRAIALATRNNEHAPTPPFNEQAHPHAASLWKALHTLPRPERIAWIISNTADTPFAVDDGAFIMGVDEDEFVQLCSDAQASLAHDIDEAARIELLNALVPAPDDEVPRALAEVRAAAKRRWIRSGALLVLAILIFMAVFGSIMVDLVGRDDKDTLQREQFDRAQQEFSNPMPPIEHPAP